MKGFRVQFAYNSGKAAASHLTRLMATEFALKNIPVRVNAVAPGISRYLRLLLSILNGSSGVYASEMTEDRLPDGVNSSPEQTNNVGLPLVPIPAGRPGS